MGYRTQFFGEMTISLKEEVLDKLQRRLEELGASKVFDISLTKFKVAHYWKNHDLFEQVLVFIEQNGNVLKGSFRLEGDGFFDKKEIKLQKGNLIQFIYRFNHSKTTGIPFEKTLVKLRTQTVRDYEILGVDKNSPLYDEVEEILINHMSGMESFTKKNHKLFTLIMTNKFTIRLKTPAFMIEFRGDDELLCSITPFEKEENGTFLKDVSFDEDYQFSI